MPRYIVKLGDRYCEWSTITDKPRTALLTLDNLKEIMREEAVEEFEREFSERMKRVESQSHSSFESVSVEELLDCNRAGDDESRLSLEEIQKKYWWDYENEENNTMWDR